jgi:hypothetical protein
MREAAVVELAESTVAAIDETLTGEMIACSSRARPSRGLPAAVPRAR